MPRDPFIREKFTREHTAARKLAEEYFARYPKDRYQTEVESWRNLQSANIEFTMKRLREPIEGPESGVKVMTDEPFEMVDPSGLTDADWAQINQLQQAYKQGGKRACSGGSRADRKRSA